MPIRMKWRQQCLTFSHSFVPQYRAEYSVPSRTEKILKAIEECDFQVHRDIKFSSSSPQNSFADLCWNHHQGQQPVSCSVPGIPRISCSASIPKRHEAYRQKYPALTCTGHLSSLCLHELHLPPRMPAHPPGIDRGVCGTKVEKSPRSSTTILES